MSHMKPLPAETTPELREDFAIFENILGFVPNSLLTMQRRPEMVKGFGELTKGVMDPDGGVHRVQVGNFLGRAHGKIVETTDTYVAVVEIVSDGTQDGWVERPRTIKLSGM